MNKISPKNKHLKKVLVDPIDDFLRLRQKVPKFSDKEIEEAINKGRE